MVNDLNSFGDSVALPRHGLNAAKN